MSPECSSQKNGPTVVGIGASAGGLTALKTFLENVPSDSGLAFVVVVHLSPDHESHMAEILQPHVHFPVTQVSDTVPLVPNHVFVIPPNANLSAIDTHLRVSKLEERRQERAPIDHFLRTLASTHDGNAIAVILSGTGSDGTLGVKDVKASGGLVIVQDPNEAEYDGMPQSAIATGLTDFILPVQDIPETILKFERTEPRVPLPQDGDEVPQTEAVLLQKVFAQLRARTDRDFSRYKRSTVLRRIARRMQLNYLEDISQYLDRLREHPEEVRALAPRRR
jgi:two-component system, chemotaxis family, CheB/CheR fusion protein